jgi:hypothetical protein
MIKLFNESCSLFQILQNHILFEIFRVREDHRLIESIQIRLKCFQIKRNCTVSSWAGPFFLSPWAGPSSQRRSDRDPHRPRHVTAGIPGARLPPEPFTPVALFSCTSVSWHAEDYVTSPFS